MKNTTKSAFRCLLGGIWQIFISNSIKFPSEIEREAGTWVLNVLSGSNKCWYGSKSTDWNTFSYQFLIIDSLLDPKLHSKLVPLHWKSWKTMSNTRKAFWTYIFSRTSGKKSKFATNQAYRKWLNELCGPQKCAWRGQ